MSNQVDFPFGSYLKGLIGWGVGGLIFGGIFYAFFGEMIGGDFISWILINGAGLMLTKVFVDIWNTVFK